jgi:nucleotide-binding universal stress UspA family protein
MAPSRIVVGYDGSESSRVALTWALDDARWRGVPVLIAHVLEPALRSWISDPPGAASCEDMSRDAAERHAQRLVSAAEHECRREVPGVGIESLILQGSPAAALLDQLGDAEMVVVGSRGLGAFTELLLGSTVVQLVSHAPCPVVVVRSLAYRAPGPEAGRVVVGVDVFRPTDETLAFAFEEASLRGVGLTAIHACQAPFVETRVDTLLAPWRRTYPEVDVRQQAVRGEPVTALVDASIGAALVVVGSRGAGGFRGLLRGSVSHSGVHHAQSAVALVRHPAWPDDRLERTRWEREVSSTLTPGASKG